MKARILLLAMWALVLPAFAPAQSPGDPNEGARFTLGPASGTYRLSWWGRSGTGYLIRQSDDLVKWQYLPMIEFGDDAALAYGFTTTADRLFLRLQIDAEPFSADRDENGVYDGYQALNSLAPNSGGLTYLQQYLQGRAPGANNAPGRLPDGGNVAIGPVYGTATPGGGGAGPQVDPAHDWDNPDSSEYVWVRANPKSYVDGNGWTVEDDTTARLDWGLVGASAQTVRIQRRESSGPWTTIATAAANATSYDDDNGGSGLLAGVNYLYRLLVTDITGQTFASRNDTYSFPLLTGMDTRRSSIWRGNPGFSEYVRSAPPKHYLVRTNIGRLRDNPSPGTEERGAFTQTIRIAREDGTRTYSGISDYYRSNSDGSSVHYHSEQNAAGSWTGTLTSTPAQGGGPPPSPYNALFFDGRSDASGNEVWTATTYSRGSNGKTYSEELSDEYTPSAFFADTISMLPDYGEWAPDSYYFPRTPNGYFGYSYYHYGGWMGHRSKTLDNSNLSYVGTEKVQYRFHTNRSVPQTVKFYDVFVPYTIDPANPPSPEVVGSHTFSAGPPTATAEFEIDPSTQPDPFTPEARSGQYYVQPGAMLSAAGTIPDESGPDSATDYTESLDHRQKSDGSPVLKAPDADGNGAITGTVSISEVGIPGSTYTVNFTNVAHFTVEDNLGNIITSGTQITQADLDAGTASLSFTITAKTSAADGEAFTFSFTTRDVNGTSFGTDSVTFTNQSSAGRDFTIPLDEASGSRYRKIGLNGRPLGDEKPQQTAESDEENEETYIDALTLGLRHSTTDVYVPVPGSDLAITARRDVLSETWNLRNGLRPHERVDRPFGACWSSNLCVNVDWYESDENVFLHVTDQNGARHRFLSVHDDDWNEYYIPLPSDSRENGDFLTSFDSSTFTDRYGTRITFNYEISVGQSITGDRNAQSSSEHHAYYGVESITDRHGNTLTYSYPDPETVRTLIPSTITLAGSPNQVLSIAQDATGHITKLWDPNGNRFDYGYEDKVCTFNGQQSVEKVLTSVTGPDGHITRYTYDFAGEADLTPDVVTNGQPTDKFHLDAATITDASGNTHGFTYALDQTRWSYSTSAGYFKQTGATRNVTNVTLPGNLGSAIFANQSKVAIDTQPDANGKIQLTGDSRRQFQVTDAGGNVITCKFGGGPGNSVVFNVGGLHEETPPSAVPKIVFYRTMQIDYAGGFELFTFDPAAGLALSGVRDFSGNTTSYVYGDAYTPPAATVYPKLFPVSEMMTKYSDPTSQADQLGQQKSFTYGAYRIMDSVTDENGRHRSYQLDGGGKRLNEVVHSGNAISPIVQRTEFAYENAAFPGVVTRKTLKKLDGPAWSLDLVTEYLLDANGRVWKETADPDGLALTTTSLDDRNGNKLSVTDPNGHTTGFEYDLRNRLTRVVYADGSARRIDYYPNGRKWHETDENGHVATFEYDVLNRLETQTRTATMNGALTPLVTRYGYENAVKPKTSVIDPNGHATTFGYDSLLRLTLTTDALNQPTQFRYDGPNSGSHAFDGAGFKPTSITDPRGYVTTIHYDNLYRVHETIVQHQLSPALFAKTTTNFDGVGNPTEVIDPLLHSTVTEYDALNRPHHVTYADARDVWTYYTPTGLHWKVKDELGYETETRYDAAGRAVLTLSPFVDDGLNPEQADRAGHLKQAQTQTLYQGTNVAATINPLLRRWDYTYDVRNRRIEEQQPSVIDAATGAAARPTMATGYDYVGNVVWVQDARGYTTETTYDEVNRPLTTLSPPVPVYGSGAAVRPATSRSYDQNGNVLTVTDANGHVTTNTYDWLNRLKTTVNAENITVRYDYDEAGNRTSVKDGLNQETTLAYDGLNRNTRVTDAAGKVTILTYDGVNSTSRTDANAAVTSYGYDVRNRLASVTYPGRPADNRTYGYDFVGSLRTVTEPGKGGAADVAYAYDALRRALTETSHGATHAYRQDLAGNRLGVQYGLVGGGNGRLVTSSYDALNRLSTLSDGTRNTSYAYDLNGNLLTKTLPNRETVTMAYDGLNRMFSEKGASLQGTLYNYLSLRDAAGSLRFSSEYSAGVPTRTLVLGYDTADRLVSEKAFDASNALLSATSHGYDAANNRTGKTMGGVATTYICNNLNQLTSWTDTTGGSAVYTYDFNGNRTNRSTGGQADSYGYDAENRLVSLAKNTAGGTGSYSYVYDYRTRRVSRTENGATTDVVFSGGTSVQEYSGAGVPPANLTVDYVRGSDWGGGVGGILYSMRAGTPSFAHYNRRGDVTTRTASAGVITYQASYEADGTRTAEFGATADRQKANTKEEDPTGLLNEGFRYRDLETLTFTTRDPAGFVAGPNLYAYVRQNPWSKFDPEGLAVPKNDDELKQRENDYKQAQGRRMEEQEALENNQSAGNRLGVKMAQRRVVEASAAAEKARAEIEGYKALRADGVAGCSEARQITSAGKPYIAAYGQELLVPQDNDSIHDGSVDVANAAMMASGAGGLIRGGVGLLERAAAGAAAKTAVNSMGGHVLPATTVRTIARGEKIVALEAELAELTYKSGGLEHAVISLQSGQRVVVSGGRGGIEFGADLKRVIGHTHPTPTGPSAADFQMLRDTGQRHSYIYELIGGSRSRFNLKE